MPDMENIIGKVKRIEAIIENCRAHIKWNLISSAKWKDAKYEWTEDFGKLSWPEVKAKLDELNTSSKAKYRLPTADDLLVATINEVAGFSDGYYWSDTPGLETGIDPNWRYPFINVLQGMSTRVSGDYSTVVNVKEGYCHDEKRTGVPTYCDPGGDNPCYCNGEAFYERRTRLLIERIK
jgi:hypothetical protein